MSSFVEGDHTEATFYASIKPCENASEVAKAQSHYIILHKEYLAPRLVSLNGGDKLAIFCKDGIHDLLSTSTLTLHALEGYFGPASTWSVKAAHSYWKHAEFAHPDVMLSIHEGSSGALPFKESKKLKLFVGDGVFPVFSDDPNPIEVKLFRTGSTSRVLYAYAKWTEPSSPEVLEATLDLKFITAIPAFNRMLMKHLFESSNRAGKFPDPLKILVQGLQYKQSPDEEGLCTSNVEGTSLMSLWPSHQYKYAGNNYVVEERYKVNKTCLSTVYGNVLDHKDKFSSVAVLRSNADDYNYPRLIDMIWLSDQNALEIHASHGSSAGGATSLASNLEGGSKRGRQSIWRQNPVAPRHNESLRDLEHWKNYWK